MRQTISFITLGVGDLAVSRAFYAALGWRESSGSQPEIAFFKAGSVVFGLFQRAALAADANVSPAGSGFSGFTLAHNVASQEEVDRLLGEAAALGASVVQPAGKVVWGGYRGYFADPDGFLWEVCWNPFFPLDAAGNVCLPP
ncbi:MAG TPA: VOC family protein [Azonexus sp.]|jgi:predicted lactoylglutathione lyase|nr:VOC family protein [Azonexus sp.]